MANRRKTKEVRVMKLADVFYQSLLEGTRSKWDVNQALSGSIPWDAWREGLRGALTDSLGKKPVPVDLAVERGEPVACEGYTRERLSFMSEKDLRVPAYLLVPDEAKDDTQVVVALHGHGYGVRAIVGLSPDDQPIGDEEEYQKNFAVRLVRAGFVVIAPELLGFGDLRLERDDDPANPNAISCGAISSMLLTIGRTMAGARVWQAMRSLDALRAMGYAGDASAMGISGGGLVCAYFAALDDCIRACCVSGFANTFRGSIFAMHHCIDNYPPNILLEMEEPDVLSAIAPRPMIWESGDEDPIFPLKHVYEARDTVAKVYEKLGAADAFEMDVFHGDHQIHGTVAMDFLRKHGWK